jgi:hypothetical protein
MSLSWQTRTGQLICRWSDIGVRTPYQAPWTQDVSDLPSGYLPPLTNFASHSPFGGPSWFERYSRDRDSE